MNNLIKIVDNFKGKRIGVIGDLMLDQFIWGDTERISPEAPVPVVLFEKESFSPGGAGNTASNIAALGGKVYVLGLIGKDEAGSRLLREFKKRGVDTRGIIKTLQKPTTQKIRVITRGQQVVRIDKEKNDHINTQIEKEIVNCVSRQIKSWDSLIISDYAKGFVTKNLVNEIIKLAKKYQKPIIGDARPKHASYFKNITLLTPNYKEAIEITGIEDLKKAGKAIQKQLKCDVLITQGSEGMTLFEKDKVRHFWAKAREVFDVAGAGDTVVGTFALALIPGANFQEATIIANCAAGIVVGKPGVATVTSEELKKELKNE